MSRVCVYLYFSKKNRISVIIEKTELKVSNIYKYF